MKKVKSILSILLAVVMIATMTVPSFAMPAGWDYYWDGVKEGIIMQPGADETERRFSWYMPADVTSCSVEISTSALMLNPTSYEGSIISAYQGDKVAKVTVSGLELGETYYYVCVSGEDRSDMYSFETVEDDSFSAIYISDIHITEDDDENENSLKETSFNFANLLADAKTKSDINIILSAGDQASDGIRPEYEGLTFSPVSRSLTFATAIGNHDRKCLDYKYFKNLPNEDDGIISSYQGGNYYFVKGEVLFLVIDSNNTSGTSHRNFIENAVEENPDVKWRVVIMHHDLYGETHEGRKTDSRNRRLILTPIFDEFNIDIVLQGHSHHYSISDVIYNNESVQKIENGSTIENANGTIYMVSASVGRARDTKDYSYGDLISIGMNDFSKKLYNIIDFSEDAIKVTTYEVGEDDAYASFTLTKTDDHEGPEINWFRKAFNKIVGFFGTIGVFFDNFGRYYDFIKDGYKVDFFEVIF